MTKISAIGSGGVSKTSLRAIDRRVYLHERLAEDNVARLLQLYEELPQFEANGYTRRIGAGLSDNLSVYSLCKIEMLPMAQRRRFRAEMPEALLNKSYTEYFLTLPPGTGHIDRMVYWLGKNTAMRINAFALKDNQSILIDRDGEAKVLLTPDNIRKYEGWTAVVSNADNAILHPDNFKDWLGKYVEVRQPLKESILKKGQGISFVLNNVHQIPRSNEGQLWAIIGTSPV